MQLWRISNFADLSGRGGVEHGSRWNRKGIAIVYCADHPSTSLLESLVHYSKWNVPDSYQLLAIDGPDETEIEQAQLPANWQDDELITQDIGTNFLSGMKSALLRIPSVVMPQASNYLLNPAHPDASQFRVTQTWRYPFDSRLLI
jgi:RES domain-containing protein